MKVVISLSASRVVGVSPAIKKISVLNAQRKRGSAALKIMQGKKTALKESLTKDRKALKADPKNVSLTRKIKKDAAAYKKLSDSIVNLKSKIGKLFDAIRKNGGVLAKLKKAHEKQKPVEVDHTAELKRALKKKLQNSAYGEHGLNNQDHEDAKRLGLI